MRRMISVLMFIHCSICIAAPLPKGCVALDANQSKLKLPQTNSVLYYVHNSHSLDLYLVDKIHTKLTTKLTPNSWSVLVPDKKLPTEFTCVESKPGSEQHVACNQLLTICKIPLKTQNADFIQTAWAIENTSLENANAAIIKQRFQLLA